MEHYIDEVFGLDELYSERAEWANNNNAIIVELDPINGERQFQLQAIHEPTVEELKENKRQERNDMLVSEVDNRISNPIRWMEFSEEEQNTLKEYRQYLLNFTEQDDWWKLHIMTFEEWNNE